MANEIQISAVTGLTPSVQLYSGATPVGSPFAATEIGTTGEYVASMPTTPYGRYLVLVTVGSDVKIGSGEIFWGGEEEITAEYHQILGLNPNQPSTTTQTDWGAGTLHIDITGDGTTSTTMTRPA